MQLWMSGELQNDVADQYREARKLVEGKLNERFRQTDYGNGLREWTFIAMIFGADGPNYKEVKRYDRRSKSCEFRLRINHAKFRGGDVEERAGLLCEALLECLNKLEEMRIDELKTEQIRADCVEVARSNGWRLPASPPPSA
jgi:hypothetical protein